MKNNLAKQLLFCVSLLLAGCSGAKEEKRVVALVTKEGFVDELPSEAAKKEAPSKGSLPVYASVQIDSSSGKVKAYRTWLSLGDKEAGVSPWVVSDTLAASWQGIFVVGGQSGGRL